MAMNSALLRVISRTHLLLYRLTAGRIGASLAGRPMLLLTTIGRKTGKSHSTPLQYMEDCENMIVVASNGGNRQHPTWWFNLKNTPEAEVQVRSGRKRVKAETANVEERSRLWPLLVETYPGYDEYQKNTKRTIQVVILQPDE
jgi:F420H(2)-dependent quinone reductase